MEKAPRIEAWTSAVFFPADVMHVDVMSDLKAQRLRGFECCQRRMKEMLCSAYYTMVIRRQF